MLYVTGDVHGQLDRFEEKTFKKLTKGDTLFILGDFGFLWDGSAAEKKALAWLAKRPYRILFLDGCHENYEMLAGYPEEEFCGGRVQHIAGSVYHVCRGSLLELEGRTLFCLGGGESDDIEDRQEGVNWWRAELPEPALLEDCRQRLESRDWQVDYILTHDAPGRILEFMGLNARRREVLNPLQVFLNELNEKGQYTQWLFGRYHADRRLGSKMQEVFGGLVQLETEPPAKKSWIFRKK